MISNAVANNFTINDARRLCLRRLQRGGLGASAEAETTALLEAVTGLNRSDQLLRPERTMSGEERAKLAAMLHRRLLHEPLQHITGTAPFYGLELGVSPAVLVPRPETERLVELTLAELTGERAASVLDVGTGSGAIALALKAERPDLDVWACDISAGALAIAIENAGRLQLEVRFRRSDLLADPEIAEVAARAAVIVANLPYLPVADEAHLPLEVRHDPPEALFGGKDGLEVAERLRRQAQQVMLPGALLALELDERNAGRMASEMAAWRDVRLEADLLERRRFVLARR